MTADGIIVKEGDWISRGRRHGRGLRRPDPDRRPEVRRADRPDHPAELGRRDFRAQRTAAWQANGKPTRGLQVWANADYPTDAARARTFGALGIGLCRTEHMFFEAERLPIVQRMILAETSEDRTAALNELLPFQRSDFDGLFEAMTGLPVIIRLIDPPLHEFMPDEENLLRRSHRPCASRARPKAWLTKEEPADRHHAACTNPTR